MKISALLLLVTTALVGCSAPPEDRSESIGTISQGSHAWSTYRWAPYPGERTIQLNSNLNGTWAPFLVTASTDWTASSVLNTTVFPGIKNPKTCKPTFGQVEVCNASYGRNGWLGIAQIWLSGGYIVQGVVKLNDSYFNLSQYNTFSYRSLVACQEVGHTFGLGHQDENQTNANLGSCMDYSNHPAGNEHPNAHDYEQLEIIYATAPSTLTLTASDDAANEWGEHRSSDEHSDEYIRRLGKDEYLVTHVLRAD